MITDLKPYPVYKDSGVEWLGDVPEHWEVQRIKSVVNNVIQLTGELQDGDLYVALEHVESWTGRLRYASSEVSFDSQVKRFQTGDVIFGKLRPYLAKVTRPKKNGVCVGEFFVLRPYGSNVTAPYMEQLLRSKPIIDAINCSTFGAKMPRADWQFVGGMVVPLPSLPEQTAIVRFLDYVDNRIRRSIHAKQKLITLLEEEKQAIIHHAVTRGIDPDVPLKSSGVEWLGDVPEHWEVKPAKFFFREVDERSTTGTEELLSVSHITGVTPRSQKNITMFMAESNVGHKLCRPGDLVINTMWAWMAALGVSKQVGLVSPSYGVYRPIKNSQLLSEYVDLVLRSAPYRAEYLCRSTGIRSSRLRLYPEQFLRIKLICPPVDEQKAILKFLKSENFENDNIIATTNREIGLIREYRTRLIADVVTGKLDVREVAANLSDENIDKDILIEDVEIPENEMSDIDECDWNEEVRE